MNIYQRAGLCTVLLSFASFTGCAHMSNLMKGMAVRMETTGELAEIRQDTRDTLADQRREAMRADAQMKHIEADLCAANKEQLRRSVESQLRDRVDSKVAFNVSQALEVGELEVDVEALKDLLEERENLVDNPPTENLRGCNCDEKYCGCSPGLKKRHCRHCRHKRCHCDKEPDCGGPETLERLTKEPLRKPLKPTEIPLKLPVRLVFGMENPRVIETSVGREPVENLEKENIYGCDKCDAGACDLNHGAMPPAPVVDDSVSVEQPDSHTTSTRMPRNKGLLVLPTSVGSK